MTPPCLGMWHHWLWTADNSGFDFSSYSVGRLSSCTPVTPSVEGWSKHLWVCFRSSQDLKASTHPVTGECIFPATMWYKMQSERNGKLKESYLSVKDSYNLMFQQTVIWRWWVLQNIYLTDSNLLHPTPQGQNQKPNKKKPSQTGAKHNWNM